MGLSSNHFDEHQLRFPSNFDNTIEGDPYANRKFLRVDYSVDCESEKYQFSDSGV